MINMDKHEEALVEKYGFVVTTEGNDYIVRDPQVKKSKFVSRNLYSLLLKAVDARNKLKIEVTGDGNSEVKSNVVSLTRQPQPGVGIGGDLPVEPDPLEPAAEQASPTATPVPTKGNKLYLIKKMLLQNPKSTVSEITAALKAEGFTTSPSTISTVRSDFLHSMRVIKDMNRWKEC